MQLRYGLDERPPLSVTFIYGLQWFAIAIPTIIIIGRVTGSLQSGPDINQTAYLQKVVFIMGLTLLVQLVWGHRLPIIAGPATVLLVGIVSSAGIDPAAISSAIIAGGLMLAILGVTGSFERLRRLFAGRIIAVVLMLIAFTLSPTVIRLIAAEIPGAPHGSGPYFAFAFIGAMVLLQCFLRGMWKSTLILWGMISGTIVYYLVFAEGITWGSAGRIAPVSGLAGIFPDRLAFDLGVMLSFLICYLALSVNDLGSIQSVSELLSAGEGQRRVSRGIALTGAANLLSGIFGVIGPVNYSLSPGVIASTGCASRYALFPAAVLLLLLSFSPAVIFLAQAVPPVLIGSILAYILGFQVLAGYSVIPESDKKIRTAIVVAAPVALGTITAFLPPSALDPLPSSLRPLAGNGFVIGVAAAMVLEKALFGKKVKSESEKP